MRIRGGSRTDLALARGTTGLLSNVRQRLASAAQTPAFGLVVITPLVFAGAVGASAPRIPGPNPPVRDSAVTPMAAVYPSPSGSKGPRVVAVDRPPLTLHSVATNGSALPPAVVVRSTGVLGIPAMALTAYRNAEQKMNAANPGCGISWNLLAGIGRIESMHANGGATDAHGTAVRPIYGPALDGTLPGNEVIVQSLSPGRVTYARALGPMQFLPGTWSRYASDGDGDGKADPQNLYDSTLTAARYLCSGGLNLRDQPQVMAAILRYNNSMPYARNVLGWAAAYATGVIPIDLPPITGPIPPLGDVHLESAAGLGPGMPLDTIGPMQTGPMDQLPLIDLGQPRPVNQLPAWPQRAARSPFGPSPGQAGACTVICIEPQNPAPAPPDAPPPGAAPAAPAPSEPSPIPPGPVG